MSVDESSTRPARADTVRLESVVVGVDFAAPSIAAVDWVREHFAPEAECLVMHAIDIPEPPRFLRGAFPGRQEVLRSAREGAAARLARLGEARKWGPVRLDVREGRAEDALSRAVEDARADMVVVGEHAHPRGMWSTLGSTAEALVRTATVPVLLVRSARERAPQRILAAIDDSQRAGDVLGWARGLARRFEAHVTACHVFQPIFLNAARAVSGLEASATLEQEQLEQTEEWLEQQLRDAGFPEGEATLQVMPGDPVSALVAAQRGGDFDMVVIGSRGAGGVGRRLLGSVASGVLRGATCPVVVVSAAAETDAG